MTRRIAYVEDNDAVRESYAQKLREEGFEVNAYSSKKAALAALQKELPDLALLDISQAGDRDAGRLLFDLEKALGRVGDFHRESCAAHRGGGI